MELLQAFFGLINDLTWGWALVPFLVVMGLFFTILSGFVQFRYFKRMFRVLSGKLPPDDPKGISGREALLVSVGGRVGGGNIAGVAVAISIGGPGAVFWMWAIALVGMATSVIECSLAQLYKERAPDGSFRGGPGPLDHPRARARLPLARGRLRGCACSARSRSASTPSRATPWRGPRRTASASTVSTAGS